RYRDRICTFNDDVQGTAAVALAGLYSATRITGVPLTQQRVLFLGAGSAATGIADLLSGALQAEGQSEAEAGRRSGLFDSRGLVGAPRRELAPHKRAYAHDHAAVTTLLDAIHTLRPTALLGLSTQGGAFNEAVIRTMAEVNQRPMIFALSN